MAITTKQQRQQRQQRRNEALQLIADGVPLIRSCGSQISSQASAGDLMILVTHSFPGTTTTDVERP